jgi:hypothetical protein
MTDKLGSIPIKHTILSLVMVNTYVVMLIVTIKHNRVSAIMLNVVGPTMLAMCTLPNVLPKQVC